MSLSCARWGLDVGEAERGAGGSRAWLTFSNGVTWSSVVAGAERNQ